MSAVCPVCDAPQDQGLLCHADTTRLERDLGDVASLVADLDVTLSRQARIGSGGKSGVMPNHRDGYHHGASLAADALTNVLAAWVIDVCGEDWPFGPKPSAITFAGDLLNRIPEIRRHPAVNELVDEITDAINQARRVVDRPGNRTIIFVGPCPELNAEGGNCDGEIHAFIPTEDDRPSRMECRTNPLHKWTAIQWLRTGKRILNRIEERKQQASGAA